MKELMDWDQEHSQSQSTLPPHYKYPHLLAEMAKNVALAS